MSTETREDHYAGQRVQARRGLASAGEAFVPLSFAPGDAYQFDWSHEDIEIAGTPMRVKAAHLRLCHSRRFYIRVYPRETQEMVFDVTCPPCGPAFETGVRLMEMDDEEEQVHRGADHRRAA